MKATKWWFGCSLLLLVLSGCNRQSEATMATPTSGSLSIAVDESLKPLFQAEVQAFEGLYPRADIEVRYVPEGTAAELFLKDSVHLAILCRKLDAGEESRIRQLKIFPTSTKIGTDAIALIVHPNNPDTLISYPQLQAILQGKLTHWQELENIPGSVQGEIQLVFDNKKSSTLRFLQDSVGIALQEPAIFFALEDNQKVIEHVAQNKQAIGVIGLSWISDSDDPATQFSLHKIKVLSIAAPHQQKYVPPSQAQIAQGAYPLTREMYALSREARTGLASGLVAFLANEMGQRIILKSGLLPATMPTRQVILTTEPYPVEK